MDNADVQAINEEILMVLFLAVVVGLVAGPVIVRLFGFYNKRLEEQRASKSGRCEDSWHYQEFLKPPACPACDAAFEGDSSYPSERAKECTNDWHLGESIFELNAPFVTATGKVRAGAATADMAAHTHTSAFCRSVSWNPNSSCMIVR